MVRLRATSRYLFFFAVAVLSVGTAPATAATTRSLTFEERVEAQEAIERVYYSHQIGATKPFEEAVPRGVLERKVRRYLEESAALSEEWSTPITPSMLEAELQRIVRSTRYPDRLQEIFAALSNDTDLVHECFVRPALAARLLQSFVAGSQRHDVVTGTGLPSRYSGQEQMLPADRLDEITQRLGDTELASGSLAVGSANLEVDGGAGGGDETAVAGSQSLNSWTPSRLYALSARFWHSAVWTGSRMCVWGGYDGSSPSEATRTGACYDPLTDISERVNEFETPTAAI